MSPGTVSTEIQGSILCSNGLALPSVGSHSQSAHTRSGFGESEYFCIVYLTSSKLQDRPAVPGLSNIISRLYHQTFDHLIDQFINRSFPFKKDFVETPKSTGVGHITSVGNCHILSI